MEKIIKKKLLLIVSMLAVTFALAGCASSDKKVEFDYDPDELAQMVQDQATQYMQEASIPEKYNYYIEKGEEAGMSESVIDAIKVFGTVEKDYGKFIEFKSDYKCEEVDDKVIVSVYAECADQEAIVKATFVNNEVEYDLQRYMAINQYNYTEDNVAQALKDSGIYPYTISEYEVSANQTMTDKMKDAGANTVIGMGIVFIALIFISFIISLLKYVPALLDKETREKRKAEKVKKAQEAVAAGSDASTTGSTPAPAGIVDIVNTATGESVMNDSELVAVISAAVMAAQGGKTRVRVNYPSNDKLVVRPRKKNKR